MSNLLASLSASANTLDAFQQALGVVQNNVDNSSTPGYAAQSLNLEAQPFDIVGGLTGGVASAGLDDSRDQYAEEEVQRQTQALGQYTAQAQATGIVQSFFDVTGTSGVSAALSNLFQSFSAWSVNPNASTARQSVLSSAQTLAQSIQGLEASLSQTSSGLDGQISSTVSQINSIAAQIQQYNAQRLRSDQPDPGADAQLYNSLDNLSQLTNFSTVTQSDGTVTVLLAGGEPLVMGKQAYPLSSGAAVSTAPPPVYPQSLPSAHVYDSEGNDITSQITGGKLGGLLDTRNRVLGSILGNAQQQGTLNQFAQTLADAVNSILESGTVSTDPGSPNGAALFTYTASNAAGVAASLSLNPAITPDQLAAVDSSGSANGNANQLAALESATAGSGTINGLNLTQFFAQIAAGVGQENQTATNNEQTQQQIVSQAQSIRDQISGVSLDQQAVNVLQFQRAYQATAQVVTVINSLFDSVLQLVNPY
jgi:flagellar hook-associated protein 1 FlgK